MNKTILMVLSMMLSAPAFAANDLPDFICPRLTEGAPTADQDKIVGSTVAIFINDLNARPITAGVEGIDKFYPYGTRLTMNFQDVFNHGAKNDGEIFYAEPDQGDGTLQAACGEKSNIIIRDNRQNKTYCGQCAVNPALKL